MSVPAARSVQRLQAAFPPPAQAQQSTTAVLCRHVHSTHLRWADEARDAGVLHRWRARPLPQLLPCHRCCCQERCCCRCCRGHADPAARRIYGLILRQASAERCGALRLHGPRSRRRRAFACTAAAAAQLPGATDGVAWTIGTFPHPGASTGGCRGAAGTACLAAAARTSREGGRGATHRCRCAVHCDVAAGRAARLL